MWIFFFAFAFGKTVDVLFSSLTLIGICPSDPIFHPSICVILLTPSEHEFVFSSLSAVLPSLSVSSSFWTILSPSDSRMLYLSLLFPSFALSGGYAALPAPTAHFSLLSHFTLYLHFLLYFRSLFFFQASYSLRDHCFECFCIFGFLLFRLFGRKGKVCKTEPHLTLIRLLSL